MFCLEVPKLHWWGKLGPEKAQTCRESTMVVNMADDGFQYTGTITCPQMVQVAYIEQEPLLLPDDVTITDALFGVMETNHAQQ